MGALTDPLTGASLTPAPLVDENGQPLSTPQPWSIGYQSPADLTPIAPPRPSQQTPASSTGQSIWQRIGDIFSNAYGNPNVVGAIGGSAQVGTGGGTATSNNATNAMKTHAAIAYDAVAILLGIILVAISVFGLSQVRDTVTKVATAAATAA